MRQVVLDTETTGISPEEGHRIIEIGCVELSDRRLTGRHFHTYLNPARAVDEGAFRVHGISTEFLQDKPLFAEKAQEFWDFIEGAELIIHNAPFDVGFLRAELKAISWGMSLEESCTVFDTLVYARQAHPGQRNSLDALCKRYDIDNSNRQLHGALLDAEILAKVYLAMTGGQGSLLFDEPVSIPQAATMLPQPPASLQSNTPVLLANAHELEAHHAFVKFLIAKSGKDYWPCEEESIST